MADKKDDTLKTQPIRIRISILNKARAQKKETGFPIGRFIEDAIEEKISRLPKEIKDKIKEQ